MNVRSSVLERYSEGAAARQEALCCPIDYAGDLLQVLPRELIDKDYGCGDPTQYVRPGDVVLDLGSGSGKICYMAAQIVGNAGSVIGVDMNEDMLALARKYRDEMAQKLGGDRVVFHKGYIQDLALDVESMEAWLGANPVRDAESLARFEAWRELQRIEHPLIADASVDLVVSNCVLNLVDDAQKNDLVGEIFRVLKPGGRLAISDVVATAALPEALRNDVAAFTACVAGAVDVETVGQLLSDAGFENVRVAVDDRSREFIRDWMPGSGIEDFVASARIEATKPGGSACCAPSCCA